MNSNMAQFEIQCVESELEGLRNHYGKFTIEPLEKGQGITLGNSLRRVILSDLSGYSIVSVRIAGVNHEFSTIPGVREDVLEILLNLKEIIFKGEVEESFIIRLKVQGPTLVKAESFELPKSLTLIDPQQYIATICDNTVLEMECKVQRGTGYQLLDNYVKDESIDFLQVDAVFMPVRKVSYSVDEIRHLDGSLKDKLTLEIWTNGSITPAQSINQAAVILTNLFEPLYCINFKAEDNPQPKESSTITQILIEELQLSVRAYNCLKRAQINSVADLLDYSQEDLLEIKNFGQKSAEEVIDALQKRLGINLPKEKVVKNL